MNWFRNRSTSVKLVTGFGVMALLVALVGYQGIRGLGAIQTMLEASSETHARGLNHLQSAGAEILKISRATRAVIIDGDQAVIERRMVEIKKADEAFAREFAEFRKRLIRDDMRAKADEVEKLFRELRPHQDKIVATAKAGNDWEAREGLKKEQELSDRLDATFEAIEQGKREVMKQVEAAASSTYRRTVAVVAVVTLVAVALALFVGVLIARLIAGPLGKAAEVLEAMASGDFTRTLHADTRDEVGRMAAAMNQAVASIRAALLQVRSHAGQTALASQQLSEATEQLSAGAQEQASALEEAAASLEEITGTVKQSADNASQANQLVAGSREAADRGGQVVGAAVAAMGEISTSSRKIAAIITTIDEIAFQTNLLALNAAVEAARAGEQGRGFAVVAAEVRNLAQRAAVAAKEIKDLIKDSVGKVETGAGLVTESGTTLGEIVASVKRVTDIMGDIAAASKEQSTGIDQVNHAVTQMDQSVQVNAAQAEELASTAQTLARGADELQSLVARFKLGDEAPAAEPAARIANKPAAPRPQPRPVAAPVVKRELVAAHVGNGHAAHDGFEEF